VPGRWLRDHQGRESHADFLSGMRPICFPGIAAIVCALLRRWAACRLARRFGTHQISGFANRTLTASQSSFSRRPTLCMRRPAPLHQRPPPIKSPRAPGERLAWRRWRAPRVRRRYNRSFGLPRPLPTCTPGPRRAGPQRGTLLIVEKARLAGKPRRNRRSRGGESTP